jgi:hypothetical protein
MYKLPSNAKSSPKGWETLPDGTGENPILPTAILGTVGLW